jgi:HEAT repeat protein
MAGGRQVYQMQLVQFLSDSTNALRRYSAARDCWAIFRQITFLSLLMGFPLLIYLLLHAVFYYPLMLILDRHKAAWAASTLCLLIGISVFVSFSSNRVSESQIGDLSSALKSEKWQLRIAALKVIDQKKMEVADFQAYPLLLDSRFCQERYWLVKTLAHSRRPETFRDLLTFLNDENSNVRSIAFHSLGQRQNSQAVRPILEKIATADSWYCQMYAYNALRSLGWKQTKLP